jgi:uncharacterized protein
MDQISDFYIQTAEARKRALEGGTSYDKPLPMKTTITAPFWDGLLRHEFLLQKCKQCGKFVWYPRAWCIYCGSRELDWTPSSRKGTVYSFVVIRQVVENSPSWASEMPFAVVELDLDEGVRVYGRLRGNAEGIQIGDRAEIVFDDISKDVVLFSFERGKK